MAIELLRLSKSLTTARLSAWTFTSELMTDMASPLHRARRVLLERHGDLDGDEGLGKWRQLAQPTGDLVQVDRAIRPVPLGHSFRERYYIQGVGHVWFSFA
jgi:hypothetical protein